MSQADARGREPAVSSNASKHCKQATQARQASKQSKQASPAKQHAHEWPDKLSQAIASQGKQAKPASNTSKASQASKAKQHAHEWPDNPAVTFLSAQGRGQPRYHDWMGDPVAPPARRLALDLSRCVPNGGTASALPRVRRAADPGAGRPAPADGAFRVLAGSSPSGSAWP